jgi:hypothetical protein
MVVSEEQIDKVFELLPTYPTLDCLMQRGDLGLSRDQILEAFRLLKRRGKIQIEDQNFFQAQAILISTEAPFDLLPSDDFSIGAALFVTFGPSNRPRSLCGNIVANVPLPTIHRERGLTSVQAEERSVDAEQRKAAS